MHAARFRCPGVICRLAARPAAAMGKGQFTHLFDGNDAQAAAYKLGRPTYPRELYETILHHLAPSQRQLAVDVATGSGQVAQDIAADFDRVLATDPSQKQLDQAVQAPAGNITYQQGSAETIDLPDGAADLITVAAGLHWFDHEVFYKEAQRVLKPHGLLAYWHYQAPRYPQNQAATQLQDQIMNGTFKDAWPERYWLGRRYCAGHEPKDMELVECKQIHNTVRRPLLAMVGYAHSWSAYGVWKRQHPDEADPVDRFQQDLLQAFQTQDLEKSVEVAWEMQLSVYRNQ